jgi:ADP-heptose:LPS heptosyltransferase
MKILFITSTRLGDSVLSTGILRYFIEKYPEAEFTVACGPLTASLFEQMAEVNNVIPLKKQLYALHWIKLWMATSGTEWDILVDLRNSLISRTLKAKEKYIWGHPDDKKHKVEQLGDLIGVSPPPAPKLWFSKSTARKAEAFVPADGPVLGIGPTANWPGKMWPVESFIALIDKLTAPDSILPNARVAVFAAPGEEEAAYSVLYSVPEGRRLNVIAKASPAIAAAAIQRCALYIGNDSGLMHCAAAAGVPTLGLFGPSWPQLYRPWGPHCAYVSTPETYAQLTSYAGYDPGKVTDSLMKSLTVDTVVKAATDLWNKTARS